MSAVFIFDRTLQTNILIFYCSCHNYLLMNLEIDKNIDIEAFRVFLQEELVERCRKNPAYSLRSFAKDLNIDNSVFSKILSGKRKMGHKLASRLMCQFEMSTSQYERFIANDIDDSKSQNYEQLAIDSFAIISDWHHYAILELLRVDNYISDLEWIANSLGMTKIECRDAVERLVRVELVEKWEDGTLVDVSGGKSTNISNDMKHGALRKMQKQLLLKSIECIDKIDYEKRNNTSITMAIDTEKLPEAIDEITKFRRKMGKLLSRGSKRDQVYNLSVALCPLSNIKNKEILV
jgi:uncharacterized protein (TIGR02147 family)